MATDRILVDAIRAAACFAIVAGQAYANDGAPLSAIDWLSDSVELAPDETETPDIAAPDAALPPEIVVAPIDAPLPDRAGLIEARDYGVPATLWGRSSAADLTRAVQALPDMGEAPPTVRRLLHDLLILRLDPPADAVIDSSFFLARVDRLLEMAQLESAGKLIAATGSPDAQKFRRAFDIALLTGAETEACKVMIATPDLSPTYVARIFCLARGGQWEVAALTLGNAEALNILTPEEDQLLLHFLDAELFEGEPIPTPPLVPAPLMFRLYEAVGERIPTEQLPVPFAFADLDETVGWKARLRASERLVAVDAIPFSDLAEEMRQREPAASGGIWERVRAMQSLMNGEKNLVEAWAAAGQGGYQAEFARWMAPRLDEAELSGQEAHVSFVIGLLAQDLNLARRTAANTVEDQFLLALASGQGGRVPGYDPLSRAAVEGLASISPGFQYESLLDDGRPGEALLRALGELAEGRSGNPGSVARALTLLKELGLESQARQIAVELVLREGAA